MCLWAGSLRPDVHMTDVLTVDVTLRPTVISGAALQKMHAWGQAPSAVTPLPSRPRLAEFALTWWGITARARDTQKCPDVPGGGSTSEATACAHGDFHSIGGHAPRGKRARCAATIQGHRVQQRASPHEHTRTRTHACKQTRAHAWSTNRPTHKNGERGVEMSGEVAAGSRGCPKPAACLRLWAHVRTPLRGS